MTVKEYIVNKNLNYQSYDEMIDSGNFHIEPTEQEMKEWYIRDMPANRIVTLIDHRDWFDYGDWHFLEDKNIWIYDYNN